LGVNGEGACVAGGEDERLETWIFKNFLSLKGRYFLAQDLKKSFWSLHEGAIDAPPGRAGRYSPVGRSLDGCFRLKKRRFVVRLLVCQHDEPAIPFTTPNTIWCGPRNTENGASVEIFRTGFENCFWGLGIGMTLILTRWR